ncbi:glutathionylspermidine synthase [Cohnella faecalis]|uniref:Glutathionylspermidine synthase n=2 Tax=Cohnella faecalis TaxID=2315694 RepID=A0A398CCR5_9BACL|nr:glutathionylspermidine synthase [Cohnella faecalis]
MDRILSIGKRHDEVFQGEIADRIPYHRMNGKEYCVPAFTMYKSSEVLELQNASERVDKVYWKVLRFAQKYLPDSFLVNQLGILPALIPAARMEIPYHGVSRQDWIINDSGMKCIENNTDTPTGIPETSYLANELTSRYSSLPSTSPNMKSSIQESFAKLIEFYLLKGIKGTIAFSSYEWHLEDRINTEYVRECIDDLGYDSIYVPLSELEIVPNDGLYANGERIAILYRLYPLEYLVHDTDRDGCEKIGIALLNLVVQGKLALINPVQSVITQSKGFMALIWSLFERRDETEEFCGFSLFNDEDIQTIETYLLPSYYEATVFIQNETPYVAKSFWGREGKGTSLFDGNGALLHAESVNDIDDEESEIRHYYNNQPKIYQKRFPLQEVTIMTEDGPYSGYLLTGTYVIGGHCSGILPRIGDEITGDMAFYSPAVIIAEEEDYRD